MTRPEAQTEIDVGVIVVTFNSRAHFLRLRNCLERQTRPFRLIVIDNASRPEERPVREDFPAGAEIVQMHANTGFASANNLGVSMLDTPYVALLNPDAFPAPDWIAELLAAAQKYPEAGAFGSTQISADDPARYDGLGDCYHVAGVPWRGGYGWPSDTRPQDGEVFTPCAAAALYRRLLWVELGGFDESFFCYCEDVDLGFRIRLAGFSVRQVAAATVHHVGGASSGARSFFAVYHGTRNRLWTFVKNMPGFAFWALLPAHVAVTVLFLVVSPIRGTGRPTWRGVADGIRGLPGIFRKRTQIQNNRRASVEAILYAMTWSPAAMLRRAPVVKAP